MNPFLCTVHRTNYEKNPTKLHLKRASPHHPESEGNSSQVLTRRGYTSPMCHAVNPKTAGCPSPICHTATTNTTQMVSYTRETHARPSSSHFQPMLVEEPLHICVSLPVHHRSHAVSCDTEVIEPPGVRTWWDKASSWDQFFRREPLQSSETLHAPIS